MRFLLMLVIFFLSLPLWPAHAQTAGTLNPDRDEPLEITADETLEWFRDDQTFIARVNAVATQGQVSLSATTLTADYRETETRDMEIWRVAADGNVVIDSRETKAYGDHAVYDIDSGTAVMTGGDLKLVSPDQTVTARKKFEYWVANGKLVATGDAKVVRADDMLEAEKISAIFTENEQGERVLQTLEAVGNVVITTPEEVLTGRRGTYDAASNKAEITGNVKIRRGQNVLEGEKATVDLNTNVSTMFGGSAAGPDGRVRGVFYPGSEKKPEE